VKAVTAIFDSLLKSKPPSPVLNDTLLLTPWFCLWGYNRSGNTGKPTAEHLAVSVRQGRTAHGKEPLIK